MSTPQGPPPGGVPSSQQLQAMRQQLAAEAAKRNMSVEQYVNELKAQAARQQQEQQQGKGQGQGPQQQQQQQQGQQMPINPGAPNPQAIAVAKWLRSQDLKPRTCILNGQRKEMFKVKRAIRALQSPAYAKASAKKPAALPPVTDRATAENTFKLLPLSLLALRVSKIDPHEGHNHAPPAKKQKRTKGLWTVKVEQQQEAQDHLHFVWLYEGPQWKQRLYAVGALALLMAIVLFPLWPVKLRIGVWYLSMGMIGLIGLFFAMAIVRLILFCITVFAVPPGLWLYPNLFEDVGFFDSFRPLWGWQEDKKKKPKKAKASKKAAASDGAAPTASESAAATSTPQSATTTGSVPQSAAQSSARRRDLTPRVEEVEEDE